jgi:hypothetical protein
VGVLEGIREYLFLVMYAWLMRSTSRPSGSPRRGDRTISVAEDPNAVLSELNASGWRGECWAVCWIYKLMASTELMMDVPEEDDDEDPGGR